MINFIRFSMFHLLFHFKYFVYCNYLQFIYIMIKCFIKNKSNFLFHLKNFMYFLVKIIILFQIHNFKNLKIIDLKQNINFNFMIIL